MTNLFLKYIIGGNIVQFLQKTSFPSMHDTVPVPLWTQFRVLILLQIDKFLSVGKKNQ